ncbi:D-arabinose 5-phosphate isomerase [Citrobacter freundii]|nr:D-arabinose 5-phosphate isomerase [Citrobacter freundii]
MSHLELQPGFDFQQAGKEVLAIEREGLAEIDQYINQNFTLACEKIFSCPGKVVVMGMGKSGHIGRKMAATFASTGTPSFFVHPGEAAHGDLGMVSPQDVVIAISNSGESNEIAALIPVLKRLHVPLICMTGRPESSMARAADVHLCVKVPKGSLPVRPGADQQHDSNAGDGRCASRGIIKSAWLYRGRFCVISSRWRTRP